MNYWIREAQPPALNAAEGGHKPVRMQSEGEGKEKAYGRETEMPDEPGKEGERTD